MSHKPEKIILANMCMIYDGNKVLVQNRIKSWTGIAFPGGHVEVGESIVDSTIREIREETGLVITKLKFCGIKQWFQDDIRNICFLFKTNKFQGELKSNEEGHNFWIEKDELKKYNLANNFEIMLKVFENEDICEHYHKKLFDNSIDILK